MPLIVAYLAIVLIWSTTPLAIQWSSKEVGFLFALTSRMLIGTAICFLILLIRKQKLTLTREAITVYASAASGICGSMFFVYWGATYLPSGMIAVIFGFSPILTFVISRPLLNEPAMSVRQFFGLTLALTGLVISAQTNIEGFKYFGLGIVLVFISVSLHSLSSVLTKRYNKTINPLSVTAGGLLIASLILSLSWFVFDGVIPKSMTLQTISSIAYLGVIATGGGFVLYYYVLTRVSPVRLALLTLITPVTAIAIGILFNQETLTAEIVVGTLLIMTGLILNLVKGQSQTTDDFTRSKPKKGDPASLPSKESA